MHIGGLNHEMVGKTPEITETRNLL